ncbi:MAG: hypothetical protein ACJAS1_003526 [Oleiphilaceae bacterium]|jgi:hypothetical protein
MRIVLVDESGNLHVGNNELIDVWRESSQSII